MPIKEKEESLTCDFGFALTVAEPAESAEELAFCETGPFLTEPSQVGQKGSHHSLEVPLQVLEESCGYQATFPGAKKRNKLTVAMPQNSTAASCSQLQQNQVASLLSVYQFSNRNCLRL